MIKRLLTVVAALAMIGSQAVKGEMRLDTSDAVRPFNIGVRVGLNTSNLSSNKLDLVPDMASSSVDWKAGFTGGVVVDVMLRNFFSLQPGFFFETRSCSFQHIENPEGATSVNVVEGSRSSSYFKIPLLASFRVLLSDDVEWQLDFGPYFSFGIGGNEKYSTLEPGNPSARPVSYKRPMFGDNGFVRSYDWGFKMGMGLNLFSHYYVGVHYEAGCRNVLLPNAYTGSPVLYGLKGRNKGWDFTIGYNF